tara:strand:- start:319 stop:1851 length:1533 start_codon:yes stop_codon:yes gene_type:complete
MTVCKHPNNINYEEENCNGNEKYNICYGDGKEFKNLKEIEEHVNVLEKDATLYGKLSKLYTPGCWENKTNQPFLKDFKKLDEKDPTKCLTRGNKWITGDGYIIKKKEGAINIKQDTASKIVVQCSPGYEGEPGIEVDACEDYTDFKLGDKGEYQQFKLLGCDLCPVKYGGNINEKEDKSCYPQCGSMGTELFTPSNSNKKLRFIDTKFEFKEGEERGGYCCDDKPNVSSMIRIKDSEILKDSNYLDCSVSKCNSGYIRDKGGSHCCRQINNSKDDIEYKCGINSENTEPDVAGINYCKDGYYPSVNQEGLNVCRKCSADNIHPSAEVTCDIYGKNIKINPESDYKCLEGSDTFYSEQTEECQECPYNKEMNVNYDKDINNSNICECKDEYLIDGACFECGNIEFNEEYPENSSSKCKCNIDDYELPENAAGSCNKTILYSGESCNITCKEGYSISGVQPKCFEDNFNPGSIKCTKVESEETTEGFSNKSTITKKRLFLIFLLIILILNLL